MDYLGVDEAGADGPTAFKMDKDHVTGSVVGCQTCHHPKAESLDQVTFPSDVKITDIKSSATCMVCHQGRSSTSTVTNKVADLPEDSVNSDLSFINIHYRAAAATLLGSEVQGGFEYPSQSYAGRFTHVDGFSECIDCHNPHSLTVEQASCAQCHQQDALEDIRIGKTDFDGDSNIEEGIASEIMAIHTHLGNVIAEYARNVSKQAIIYDSHAYPYFFNDKNANTVVDENEAIYPNRYQSWTPRLLKAAYNYQFVAKDPGAYAHNPAYVTQLLFDSVNDIERSLSVEKNTFVRPK